MTAGCQTCGGSERMAGGAPCPFCRPVLPLTVRRLISLASNHPDPQVALEAARKLQELNK